MIIEIAKQEITNHILPNVRVSSINNSENSVESAKNKLNAIILKRNIGY